MNVVIIAHGFLSTKGFSGGSTNIIHLARGLQKRGAHITFITSGAGRKIFQDAGLDGDFRIIAEREEAPTALFRAIPILFIRMLRVCMLLGKKKLDEDTVVYCPTELLWDEIPLLFVRGHAQRISFFCMPFPSPLQGYKGAFSSKKLPDVRATLGYIQQWWSFKCFRFVSDAILVVSNLSDFLVSRGVSSEKLAKFNPGVELDVIDKVTPEGKKYSACWIGRYHAMKGLEDLVEVWKEISLRKEDAKLVLMGNVTEQMEPLIKANHLEGKIILAGVVTDEGKYKIMKESEIFTFPSYYESWNRAICEAMACGLPVVAYDLPVYKDSYPKGIITVPVGDKKAFDSKIMRLLDNRAEREKLSSQAMELASSYGSDAIVQGFMEAVQKAKAHRQQ
jgi:glycosyltransferase involved in cell wall biosynthesis